MPCCYAPRLRRGGVARCGQEADRLDPDLLHPADIPAVGAPGLAVPAGDRQGARDREVDLFVVRILLQHAQQIPQGVVVLSAPVGMLGERPGDRDVRRPSLLARRVCPVFETVLLEEAAGVEAFGVFEPLDGLFFAAVARQLISSPPRLTSKRPKHWTSIVGRSFWGKNASRPAARRPVRRTPSRRSRRSVRAAASCVSGPPESRASARSTRASPSGFCSSCQTVCASSSSDAVPERRADDIAASSSARARTGR